VCRFASRCPAVHERCSREMPALLPFGGAAAEPAEAGAPHRSACHVSRWTAREAAPLA